MTTSLFSPQTLDAALRLGSAVAIGGLVGFDRGLRQKPAGLRTHALVSLGAALMTYTGLELAPAYPGDNTRVLQGIIAGVGFLGGGVILRDSQDQRVRGLTTAASIWIVAGLGMACGAGHWRTALVASAFTLLVLVAGRRIEQLLAAPLTGLNGADHAGVRVEAPAPGAGPAAPPPSPLSPGSPPVARSSPARGSA
jgi:putative Mg2+ transporter-C (MgtC) family protein